MLVIKETRHDKFRRIAKLRVGRITENLMLISNLSNTKNYKYQQKDVEKYFGVLFEAITSLKNNFDRSTNNKIPEIEAKSKLSTDIKEIRFDKLMTNRINKIIADINLISNLGNRKHYTYTIQDIDKIITYLEESVLTVKEIFLFEIQGLDIFDF